MGGKGSGRFKKGEGGVPYEHDIAWQANDPANVDPKVNHRVLSLGKELMSLPPVDFSDVEALRNRFFTYLDLCDKWELKPMVMGLVQALGISGTTFYDVLSGEKREFEHYRGATRETRAEMKKMHDFMQFCWENYLMEENRNPVKWIFLGKNYFGYEDSTVRVQREANEQLKLGDPSEIAARYAKLLGKPTSEVIEIEPEEVEVVES